MATKSRWSTSAANCRARLAFRRSCADPAVPSWLSGGWGPLPSTRTDSPASSFLLDGSRGADAPLLAAVVPRPAPPELPLLLADASSVLSLSWLAQHTRRRQRRLRIAEAGTREAVSCAAPGSPTPTTECRERGRRGGCRGSPPGGGTGGCRGSSWAVRCPRNKLRCALPGLRRQPATLLRQGPTFPGCGLPRRDAAGGGWPRGRTA